MERRVGVREELLLVGLVSDAEPVPDQVLGHLRDLGFRPHLPLWTHATAINEAEALWAL